MSIYYNINEVATGVGEVSSNINGVTTNINEVDKSAENVKTISIALAEQSKELQAVLNS